jgi:mRNA interferase RelE/StbE
VDAYRIDIPLHVAAVLRRLPPEMKRPIRNALRALSVDPALGEPLVRELEGLWKYRVRRFRIVYASVDRRARVLRIYAVGHRRTIYEEIAAEVRQREP